MTAVCHMNIVLRLEKDTINGLKYGKGDGSSELLSDRLLYACDNLAVVLSILFTVMLRRGIAPAGMLIGTRFPFLKDVGII